MEENKEKKLNTAIEGMETVRLEISLKMIKLCDPSISLDISGPLLERGYTLCGMLSAWIERLKKKDYDYSVLNVIVDCEDYIEELDNVLAD